MPLQPRHAVGNRDDLDEGILCDSLKGQGLCAVLDMDFAGPRPHQAHDALQVIRIRPIAVLVPVNHGIFDKERAALGKLKIFKRVGLEAGVPIDISHGLRQGDAFQAVTAKKRILAQIRKFCTR